MSSSSASIAFATGPKLFCRLCRTKNRLVVGLTRSWLERRRETGTLVLVRTVFERLNFTTFGIHLGAFITGKFHRKSFSGVNSESKVPSHTGPAALKADSRSGNAILLGEKSLH